MSKIRIDNWLFYTTTVSVVDRSRPLTLPYGYTCELWRPQLLRLVPECLPTFPFVIWWLLHTMRVFANREYGVFVIRHGTRAVHRSVITPRYFRFPFMAAADVQVGDTWTDPSERGKGLATIALENIVAMLSFREGTCWYVVEPGNVASIRVVEKSGFTFVGSGIRTRRFGLGILGTFLLTDPIGHKSCRTTRD